LGPTIILLTMRKLKNVLCLGITAVVLASCGTSNDVVSNGIFQKRKHTSGIFVKTRGNAKTADEAVVEKQGTPKREAIAVEQVRTASVEKAIEMEETQAVANTTAAVERTAPASDDVLSTETETSVPAAPKAAKAPVVSAERKSEGEIRKSLKMDLKKQKKQSGNGYADDMFILAIIFAILIPPIGVLIYTNIDWMKVLICLLLTLLFFLPGMIYALLVVFDVL